MLHAINQDWGKKKKWWEGESDYVDYQSSWKHTHDIPSIIHKVPLLLIKRYIQYSNFL